MSGRWWTSVAVVVCCVAVVMAVPASGRSGTGPSVTAVDSLTRVGYEAPAVLGGPPDMVAARGETESFQLVVSGGDHGLHDVDVEVSSFRNGAGRVLDDVTRYREHYVQVPHASQAGYGSNVSEGAGYYPDALVPFEDPVTGAPLAGEIRAAGVDVDAGTNQPDWVDVAVPPDAAPGDYVAGYTVRTPGQVFRGSVRLTVADVELPRRPALQSSFLNWSGRPAVDRELLANRIMPARPSGAPEVDGTATDVNATDLGAYSGADRETCTMQPPPSASELRSRAAAASVPGALLYNYTADEIDDCVGLVEPLRAWARALHGAGVRQLVTATPDPALFTDGAGGAGVDIWAVLPLNFSTAASAIDDARARGMQIWSYTALAQDSYSPKWLIDFSPVDHRILPGMMSQSLALTGMLYWRVDLWTDDPWSDVQTSEGSYAGDGMLVYPGEQVGLPGGAVPSMRLKWIRDGVDDYDLAELARARGKQAEAAAITRSVASSWEVWSKDPSALLAARRALLALLDPT